MPGRRRNITLDDLKNVYHLKQSEAAHRLGITLATLKRQMKWYGIAKWPYRQLACIESKRRRIEESLLSETEADRIVLLEAQMEICAHANRAANAATTLAPAHRRSKSEPIVLSYIANRVNEEERNRQVV